MVIFLVIVIEAASDLSDMNVRGLDLFEDVIDRNHWFSVCAACKDVESHVVDFWPCVAGKVRLADDYDTADSVGWESVEGDRPDLSMCAVSCFNENVLKFCDVGDSVITA